MIVEHTLEVKDLQEPLDLFSDYIDTGSIITVEGSDETYIKLDWDKFFHLRTNIITELPMDTKVRVEKYKLIIYEPDFVTYHKQERV